MTDKERIERLEATVAWLLNVLSGVSINGAAMRTIATRLETEK